MTLHYCTGPSCLGMDKPGVVHPASCRRPIIQRIGELVEDRARLERLTQRAEERLRSLPVAVLGELLERAAKDVARLLNAQNQVNRNIDALSQRITEAA